MAQRPDVFPNRDSALQFAANRYEEAMKRAFCRFVIVAFVVFAVASTGWGQETGTVTLKDLTALKIELEMVKKELEMVKKELELLKQENRELRKLVEAKTGAVTDNTTQNPPAKTESAPATPTTATAPVKPATPLPTVRPAITGKTAPPAATNPTGEKYWLSSTGKRHKESCRYYGGSSGRVCGPKEGVACRICGG